MPSNTPQPQRLTDRSPDQIRETLADKEPAAVGQLLALHDYAAREHLGLTALGHRCGISSGILSQLFNGNYPGDYLAMARRIETFFWRLEQKALYGGLREFVETDLATNLFSIFEKVRVIRRMQLIESPEQLGKTRAAKEYTERNNSGRTIYVQLAGGTRSGLGDFIWSLAESLGIPYTVKLREKRLRIKQGLEACDLVIIDEAHLVDTWTDRSAAEFWDYLRTDIFDNGSRGVVLIATNHSMLDMLRKFRRRAGYNVGQLLGRMRNEVVRIDPVEDITPDDIAALVGRYYRPGSEAIQRLTKIARTEQLGHIGLLEDILNEAWSRAKAEHKPLSDRTVLSVAQETLDNLKTRKELYS